jgi:hypothetical protein
MSLENPNTTTTIEAKTIKSLPNPGQDLTYIAQFAQDALMNTAGCSNIQPLPRWGSPTAACWPFTSTGILSPLPGSLRRECGNCDYDVRHNLSAFGVYEIPFGSCHSLLTKALGGWQVSETAFLTVPSSNRPARLLFAPSFGGAELSSANSWFQLKSPFRSWTKQVICS